MVPRTYLSLSDLVPLSLEGSAPDTLTTNISRNSGLCAGRKNNGIHSIGGASHSAAYQPRNYSVGALQILRDSNGMRHLAQAVLRRPQQR